MCSASQHSAVAGSLPLLSFQSMKIQGMVKEIKFGHIQSAIWTNKLAIWTDTIGNLQFEYEVKDIYVLDFKLLVCFFIKYSGTNLLL